MRWTCCSSVTTPILSISGRSPWVSQRKKLSKTSSVIRAGVNKRLDNLISSIPLIVANYKLLTLAKLLPSAIAWWAESIITILKLKIRMNWRAVNLCSRIKCGNRSRNSSCTRTLKTKNSVVTQPMAQTLNAKFLVIFPWTHSRII